MHAIKHYESTADLTNAKPDVAALIILQAKAPVHYSVLVATEVVWTDQIPTAGTDGVYVYVSPEYFRGLGSDSQRAFLLAHEVSHIILRHPQRGEFFRERGYFRAGVDFDSRKYNIAADYVINSDCLAMGLEKIEDGCYSDKYGRNHLVDEVYADLAQEQPKPQQSDQGGSGEEGDQGECSQSAQQDTSGSGENTSDSAANNSGASSGERLPPEPEGHDYHLAPQYDGDADEQEAQAQEDEHRVRSAVDDGIDELESGARGNKAGIPDSIREGSHRHRQGNASDTDWRAELADLLHRVGDGVESTWSRIHRRRYATLGVVSPSKRGELGRLGVVVDVSTSVDAERLNQFLTELAAAVDSLQPRDGVVIVWTNHLVVRVDEVWSGAELLDLEVPWGGGTYLTHGAEWLEENGLETDILLVFTDGELYSDDWVKLAARDAVVVLDRQPNPWISDDIRASGARTLIAA